MKNPDYCYVDTAYNSIANRNVILRIQDLPLSEDTKEAYATWHRFQESIKTFVQNKRTVRGFTGSSYSDYIPFDFDDQDLSKSLVKTREFVQMLEVSYEVGYATGVRVYFSGKKGFHVLLDASHFGGWSPSVDLAKKLDRLAKTLGENSGADLSIYDKLRLFRIPNTIHGDSGLYKTPLSYNDFISLTSEQIQQRAKTVQKVQYPDWGTCVASRPLVELWRSLASGQQKATPRQKQELFPSMSEGDGRDNQAFFIARRLRDNGLNRATALDVLRLWDRQNIQCLDPAENTPILAKKIDSAFRHVSDPEGRVVPATLKTVAELSEDYTEYVNTAKSRKILLGLKDLDEHTRGIAPGEVCTIIAKPGVGKSAFAQNLLSHVSSKQPDILSVFCSMEQPLAQCFERWAQIVGADTGRAIESSWESQEYRRKVIHGLRNTMGERVLTCGLSGLKMLELQAVLDVAYQKTGKDVNLMVIDYLGLLDTHDLDKTTYGQVTKMARGLKVLAKDRDLSVVVLCQVNRMAGDDLTSPLNIHAARDTGAIEESADFLLGLYRPDYHGEDRVMAVQVLKNRKGNVGDFRYVFDKDNLRIYSEEQS